MNTPRPHEPKNAALKWFDQRLPILSMMSEFMSFATPRNLNWMYIFGAVLTFFLVLMIVTGITLAMHFEPTFESAFDSVQHIVRDVNFGWLLQSMHANGGTFFFIAVYFHILRGFYYGSYKAPREVLWLIGFLIYLAMMATAFLGYAMINGEMSLAAAKVITGFLGAIPVIGDGIQTWVRGGEEIGNATIIRFFVLHYLLPFVIVALVVLHVWALHVVGNTNPTGVEVKDKKSETVPFHPYYTLKDFFALSVILLIYAYFVFFNQDYFGDPVNYSEANLLRTPTHIKPEWYFLPFYAILRAFPDKLLGVVAMLASIFVVALLPWLDTAKKRSARYRPMFKMLFWVFLANAFVLGWLGGQPINDTYILVSRFCTAIYFAYFAALPVLGWLESGPEPPSSISETLKKGPAS